MPVPVPLPPRAYHAPLPPPPRPLGVAVLAVVAVLSGILMLVVAALALDPSEGLVVVYTALLARVGLLSVLSGIGL